MIFDIDLPNGKSCYLLFSFGAERMTKRAFPDLELDEILNPEHPCNIGDEEKGTEFFHGIVTYLQNASFAGSMAYKGKGKKISRDKALVLIDTLLPAISGMIQESYLQVANEQKKIMDRVEKKRKEVGELKV